MRHACGIMLTLTTALAIPAAGQQSASYRLAEHVLNSGGRPLQGATAASASFHVSLDALGEDVNAAGLSSASFPMDGGFTVAYPPPGEVSGLLFPNKQTLVWDPEKSAGDYNLYRDSLSSLSALGFGACQQQDVPGETTVDAAVPAAGGGYFYLVPVENSLGEEGTKGLRSDGFERLGNICP